MNTDGTRYTVIEIADALNKSRCYVTYRIKRLGLRRTAEGYSYEDVKRIKNYSTIREGNSDPKRVEQLRKKLANDGML